jgi:molybdopterin converting factor small subunit
MGRVKVSYTHRLGEITGRSRETVEIETPLSVRGLVDYLIDRYGSAFSKEMNLTATELGERSNFYLVFVNGMKVQELQKDSLLIQHESEVSFLALVSGG